MSITLGSRYRENLHGIEGVATARTEFLTGCNHVALEYVKDAEVKTYWVDERQLELVETAKAEAPVSKMDRGGPGITPPSRDRMR